MRFAADGAEPAFGVTGIAGAEAGKVVIPEFGMGRGA